MKEDAEKTPCETKIPKLVQETFYAMVVAQAVEVGVLPEVVSDILQDVLGKFWWCSFEVFPNSP